MIASLRVEPGHPAGLSKRDPGDRLGLGREHSLDERTEELRALQDRLWAERRRSLLVILQGTDASGKDSTIRHVFTGLNPHGCRVEDFAAPSTTDLANDYLWRVHARSPARGQIGIWNRSHYEDVVAVRVRELVPVAVWRKRFRHIREPRSCESGSRTPPSNGSSGPRTSRTGAGSARSRRPTRTR